MTAGDDALAELTALWQRDIRDPAVGDHSPDADRCRGWIDHFIRSSDGLGWSWEPPYAGDGHGVEWCGATAAYAWRGHIDLAVRRRYFASTWRLDRWARYRPVDEHDENARPSGAPDRLLAEFDEHSTALPAGVVPQAGDILLVGPVPGAKIFAWGAHVTVVENFDPATGIFWTLSGNCGGFGPKGDRRQGVSRQRFAIGYGGYHARRLIRPG